jgi:hypothetical protein
MPRAERNRPATLATLAFALLLPLFIALLIADTTRPQPAISLGADDAETSDTESLADIAAPPAAALHSRWVSQSPLRVLALGDAITVSLSFRNTGSTAWIRDSAAEARLGVAGNDRRFHDLGFALNWPAPDRPAVQAERVVVPGSLASFSFQVRGAVTGVHRIPLRPLVEGVAWMEDEGAYVDVWVR